MLQALFNLNAFVSFFESGSNYVEAPNAPFTEKFSELLCTAFSDSSDSYELHSNLKLFHYVVSEYAEQFKGHSQHDAHEFFRFLIEKIHEEMNRASKKQYSEFKPMGKNLSLNEIVNLNTIIQVCRLNSGRNILLTKKGASLRRYLVVF